MTTREIEMKSISTGDQVRFTEQHLAIISRNSSLPGTAEYFAARQAEGMYVQNILPSGRVNVTYIEGVHRHYRTFSPSVLVAFDQEESAR